MLLLVQDGNLLLSNNVESHLRTETDTTLRLLGNGVLAPAALAAATTPFTPSATATSCVALLVAVVALGVSGVARRIEEVAQICDFLADAAKLLEGASSAATEGGWEGTVLDELGMGVSMSTIDNRLTEV